MGFQIMDLICIYMNGFSLPLVWCYMLNAMGDGWVGFDTQFFPSFCIY